MRLALALTFAFLATLVFVPGPATAEGEDSCEPYEAYDNAPVGVQNNGDPAIFIGAQGRMGYWSGTAYPICTGGHLPCVEDPIECLT